MSPLKVHTNSKFWEEKKYIIETLFTTFVGTNVEVVAAEVDGYHIEGGGRRLVVKDHFFHGVEESYLNEDKLPGTPLFTGDEVHGRPLPILYGSDQIENQGETTTVDFDVFASAFFMLSRWEETLAKPCDRHERFQGAESVAYKWGFHNTPVVNHYGILLRDWIKRFLGVEITLDREARVFLTHDVDSPRLWTSLKAFMQQQMLTIFEYHAAWQYYRNYGSYFKRKKHDPWDTFDLLMTQAESLGVAAHFYFIPDGSLPHETHYKMTDGHIQQLMDDMKRRGHVIGIHPSYHTLGNPEMLAQQKDILEKSSGLPINMGRQHYLRFKAPDTWRHWEQVGLEVDSSVYYADVGGYRCGACSEFSVFDVIERRQLQLKELPLSMMEATYINNMGTSPEAMQEVLRTSMKEVKALQGDYVSLWHNSSFYTPPFRKYEEVQKWMIEELKQVF